MLASKKAAEAAAVQLASANVKFRKIPQLKFAAMGVEQQGLTQPECEGRCKNDEGCASYSFNAKKNACVTSRSLVQYDLEYQFYAKKSTTSVEGETQASFRSLGSMKFMVIGANDRSTQAFPGITDGKCKQTCGSDLQCTSYCYRARDRMCITSSQDIEYSEDWSYNEKAGAAQVIAQREKEKLSQPEAPA